MIEYFSNPAFWVGLGQIIVVNILLSGDNAVVIALAARSLPPHQQKKAIIWGSVAAIVMRVILTIVAVKLLTMPYLKIVGGLLLFWIAIQLLLSEDDGGEGIESSNNVWVAIRTILIADLVMSLDNVIGVAAAAKGDDVLVILGLAISIPLIIFGSTILLKLMDRFPIIITGGAALLGWVAGEMLITDRAIADWIAANMPWMEIHLPVVGAISWAQILGAALVVVVGKLMSMRSTKEAAGAATEAEAVGEAGTGGSKLLILVDGSQNALRAVREVIASAPLYRAAPHIDLLNVQHGLPGTVRGLHGGAQEYHREEGEKALAGARELLDAAGLKYTQHVRVGDAADVATHFVHENHIREIVMGCRGASAIADMLLGSCAAKVLRCVDVPVLLVK
jgi:YjbE family integral membrane protein